MKETFDFIKAKKYAYPASGLIIILGIVFLFVQGFDYGSDFEGGAQLQVAFKSNVSSSDITAVVGNRADIIELLDNSNEYIIKLSINDKDLEYNSDGEKKELGIKEFSKKNLVAPLRLKYPKMEIKNETIYSPTQGDIIKNQALIVSLLILVLILFYIGLRFQFKFGVAAIIALIHDVSIVLAFILFFNSEMDVSTVVALMTIMGYSLNDTIVVFDRIRENKSLLDIDDYVLVVNKSIYQSLSRTVVTSLTTFFVVLCLYILGGHALKNLSFALLIGVVVGTYSSIFIASPALVMWENFLIKREKKLLRQRKSKKKSSAVV